MSAARWPDAVQGSACRVAPAIAGRPAAGFWKFWVSGDEVYATSRAGGSVAKISIHSGGQTHINLGAKRQEFVRPVKMQEGTWFLAFELRFLLSPGAAFPPREKLKKSQRAFLIGVPENYALILHLFIAAPDHADPETLPREMAASRVLWHASLRDGRAVVVTALVQELTEENRREIRYVREELRPVVTFDTEPKNPYIEIRHIQYGPNGNFVMVVPLGEEGWRVKPSDERELPGRGAGGEEREDEGPHG